MSLVHTEKVDVVLVLLGIIFHVVLVIFFLVVEPIHILEMCKGIVNIGYIPAEMELPLFLGALAFAGAGGTMNLVQSDFIRDKGYGMGAYVGRLTSPLTGKEEAVGDIGYHFEQTEKNMRRWRGWWQAANREHLITFYALSALSLMLLSLIAYATARQAPGLEQGLGFIAAEGDFIAGQHGGFYKHLFNWMGIAILLTTELGLLDACARISTDIIKVNWLRENEKWSKNRLYFLLLWAQILFGTLIMLSDFNKPIQLLVLSASLNAGVMLIYSVLLLWMNNRVLKGPLAMHPTRFIALIWSCAFFGYFTFVTLQSQIPQLWQ